MDPKLFSEDLGRKPEVLQKLTTLLQADNPWTNLGINIDSQVIFLGMGSSHYASSVAARRLRAKGINAIAELASNELLPLISSSTIVIAVSASGTSVETLYAVQRFSGKVPTICLTNSPDSAISKACDTTVLLHAEPEIGGVACRTFTHTLAIYLALEDFLFPIDGYLKKTLDSAVKAHTFLLENRDRWLPIAKEVLMGGTAANFVAPASRLSSALQSALMLREGPRIPSVGCETGDWSHVDVYLTKTQDYRLMLFVGSPWEPKLMKWCKERGSRVIAVGGEIDGADFTIRYPGDDLPDVPLLVESFLAELIASEIWLSYLS